MINISALSICRGEAQHIGDQPLCLLEEWKTHQQMLCYVVDAFMSDLFYLNSMTESHSQCRFNLNKALTSLNHECYFSFVKADYEDRRCIRKEIIWGKFEALFLVLNSCSHFLQVWKKGQYIDFKFCRFLGAFMGFLQLRKSPWFSSQGHLLWHFSLYWTTDEIQVSSAKTRNYHITENGTLCSAFS